MKIRFSLWLIFAAISLAAFNYFSPMQKSEQLSVLQTGVEVQLAHKHIISGSEKIYADSLKLEINHDYELNHQLGKIIFNQVHKKVDITYSFYPEDLITEYQLYEIVDFSDTLAVAERRRSTQLYQTNTKLNITGSKTISISVSNSQEFSLDQSLFLQLDGELGKNLNIESQLTDSQSPITPEGDSREISSLDKVFVRLYGDPYELAFGDLEMEFSQTEFMNYRSSFEGLKASWLGKQKAITALAVSKGKNKTAFLTAIEGKQGPYYLSDFEGGIQVVPGSEDLFLDGSQLHRGADYTIDYQEGSITFSNEFILTNNSFIQVTFQYSDEEFRQNMYLANTIISPIDNLVIRAGAILQSDDKDSPLQEDFSTADLDSLQVAGDGVVYGNGVVEATGSGEYILSENGEYYVYVGNGEGDYNIQFSFMGNGAGSYSSNGEGYSFVGTNNGSYEPVRLLPKSTKKNNFDLNLKYRLATIELESELLATSLDENTFSEKDDDDNNGYATYTQLSWSPGYDKIEPGIKLHYRTKTEDLNPFAEINNPINNYELEAIPDSVGYSEIGSEVRFNILNTFRPIWIIRSKSSQDFLTQRYSDLTLEFVQTSYSPQINFRWLDWEQEFENYDVNSALGENLEMGLLYKFKQVQFELSQVDKIREKEYAYFPKEGERSLIQQAGAEYKSAKSLALKFEYEKEVLDSLNILDSWDKYQTSSKYKTWWNLNLDKHSLAASYSRLSVEQDSVKYYDLAELKLQNSFLNDGLSINSAYNLRNVEFYPKLRELVYDGLGVLDSTGVYPEDEDDAGYSYEITEIDYDNPKMAVEINATSGLYITPSRFAKGLWKKIRSESQLMISENSIFPNKVELYFLQPSTLQNEKYTNYGRYRFEQSFWLELVPRLVSMDFSYLKEETMDNRYIGDSSLSSKRSYESELDYNGFKKSKFKFEYSREFESESSYDQDWEVQSFEIEMRNRLSNDTNLKSKLGYSEETGSENGKENDYKIKTIQLQQTVTYSFSKKYKLFSNLKVKHNNRSGYGYTSSIDKTEGLILIWSAKVDYKINSFTYAGLEYSGDDYSSREAQHKIKLEVKAEF